MSDHVTRFESNPLITPDMVPPSHPGLQVLCVLNPGVFRFGGRMGMVIRVAEQPIERAGILAVPVLDPLEPSGTSILEFHRDDPKLDLSDPRIFTYEGKTYLTTLSHLRLAWSDDGIHWEVDDKPTLMGEGPLESFGIEDCRVSFVDGRYVLTYCAVSPAGVGIAAQVTSDWKRFDPLGMIFSPDDKDCAVFEERIDGQFLAFHRPGNVHFSGHHIWLAYSPDLRHWGKHRCVAMTRPGHWDSARVGAGAAPIRTPEGWLAIYHGADPNHRYCLGALLLDLQEPWRVLARSDAPIMEPREPYERQGFLGDVIFTNGHLVDGDLITLYYGASDSVVCGGIASIRDILDSLRRQ